MIRYLAGAAVLCARVGNTVCIQTAAIDVVNRSANPGSPCSPGAQFRSSMDSEY